MLDINRQMQLRTVKSLFGTIYEELCNLTPFSKTGFMKVFGETKGIILATMIFQCCRICLTSTDFMATDMGTLNDYFAPYSHNIIYSA